MFYIKKIWNWHKNRGKWEKVSDYLTVILMILAMMFVAVTRLHKTETISYNDLKKHIENKSVQKISLSSDSSYLLIQLKDKKTVRTLNPDTEESNNLIFNSGITISKASNTFKNMPNYLMILMNFIIIWYLYSMMSGKKSGKGLPSLFSNGLNTESQTSDIKFDDVAGNEESKEQMRDLVTYLKTPEIYKNFGVKPPKGVIFYGPPGTGKTLLAKAVAGEAEAEFISINGSDFVDKYVGNGASRVRKLFESARSKTPCIIFIDEIDAIGGKRNDSTHEERAQTLNALLGELDGFKDDEGIIVIAATNRIETLDEALVRSGRFDTKICINLPDINAREAIFKVHSKNKPIADDVDFKYFAKITTYFSGADIMNIMNKAGFYAIKEKNTKIESSHIHKAINYIIAGDEKSDRSYIKEKDKQLTAYHETGHALVAKLYAKVPVNKITIIPTTTGAGGYTLIDNEEVSYKTKSELMNSIAIALGGRAAEDVIYGKDEVTTGASGDITNVTNTVEKMIRLYGMSDKFGMLRLDRYNNLEKDVAEESKKIIDSIYKDVYNFIESNKVLLETVSEKLLEKETLVADEFEALLEEK